MIQAPRLPLPSQYKDWSSWASALLTALNLWFSSFQRLQSPPVAIYTVANLPTNAKAGTLVVVSDEAGGEVLAWKDTAGDWRRVTDRSVVS